MFPYLYRCLSAVQSVSCPGVLPWPPSSSEEMAKRGISMMAEQQRLRTVSGGLESLSVWDDSETDRRFRRLQTGGERRTRVRQRRWVTIATYSGDAVKHKEPLCAPSLRRPGSEAVQDSHLWRAHEPGPVSGLEAAQAVESVSSLLAEAAFGGRRSPLLLVQRQTLHAAVHLDTSQ